MTFPPSLVRTVSWMRKNLVVCSSGHMTPRIRLRLLTPQCPLWTSQPDQCPFHDPYWAFYWPGGQAVTKYILDNPQVVQGKKVLDFGSGCGASAIAARLCGAERVTANDIDRIALVATALNAKLNGLRTSDLHFEVVNLIQSRAMTNSHWDVIIVGDMFYDSEFSAKLFAWLTRTKEGARTRVIIGDPGRHGLEICPVTLTPLARYPLAEHITREHYGFTAATVYELE